MDLTLYQIDAFAAGVFEGNPAAVVPLSDWLPAALMQKIAAENNLSETAFFVPGDSRGEFHLRWFTPRTEVDLCGHATLASAHAIFEFLDPELQCADFSTRSGWLSVTRQDGGRLSLDLPVLDAAPFEDREILTALTQALKARPVEVYLGDDMLAVFGEEDQIRRLNVKPDLAAVLNKAGARGLCVTATSDDHNIDFVSRFFAPNHGIPEDPVTGSAHCLLAPFWSARLEKNRLTARQISARGGTLICQVRKNRVELTGRCATYMEATIQVPDPQT